MEHYELTLSEYWRIIRKRKWTIVFVFIMVMLSTAIFTKLQTPVYEAMLELKIEKQHPVITLASNGELSLPSGPIDLKTEILLIKSLPVMRKVVERMEVLPADPKEREAKIHVLSLDYQRRVIVEQIGDTNIVRIRAHSDDPQKAALMATAIADVYIVENIESRKKQSKAVISYINKQLKEYKRQIAEEETKLQKFKQNEKVFEVTPEVKETLDRLTVEGTFEFETEMLKIDEELKRLNRALAEKKNDKLLKKISDKLLTENYIFTGLKRRLLELEFQRFLLLIDYTEKHPAVIEQDKVIAEVKHKIVNMLKNFSNLPITEEEEETLSLIIKKMFLESKKDVLYRIVNRFYGDSGSLSSNQLEYVRLKRNIDRLLEAYDTLSRKRSEVMLNLAKVIDDVVTVVSPAVPPKKPIKPKAEVNYLVSSAVGILLGLLACFIQESIDTSVSTIADVEHELNLSILGIVPYIRKDEVLTEPEGDYSQKDKKIILQRARLVTITAPKSWPAESIKMIRTNLIQKIKTKNLKAILFTSSDKQEGKSTVVTNMALSMAQLGKKTILVASNLRRPTVYKIFGIEREPGLTDILMGNISWQDALKTSTDILIGGINIDNLLQMPGIDNLNIITCGRPVDNVSEILNTRAFEQLLVELKRHYDVIIIDCSPVMAVPDAITLCSRVDGVVLVYKVGHTPKDVLKMAKSNLLHANANLLGVILNSIKSEAQVGYSAYYYRYYSETADETKDIVRKWKNRFAPHRSDKSDII